MTSIQHVLGANCGVATPSSISVRGAQINNNVTSLGNRSSAALNEQIERYPGITTEKPKHSDYAINSVRVSTFSNWCSDVMDPLELAEAGFFYTGTKDCVRCFFCGGGMKDWERGDNAWIEHARWFPNCAYVRLFKGEEFINMCRMVNIGTVSNDQELQNMELLGRTIENSAQVVEDRLIEDLNSKPAKLIMNMGYNQEDVERAIKHTRHKHGTTELKAQYILEFLLDNTYTPCPLLESNAAAPSTNTTRLHTSSSFISSEESSHSTASSQRLPGDVSENDDKNEELRHLLDENRVLKQQMTCKVCMDKDACIVFVPCGHMVACVECALALRKCAVCRSVIHGTVRAYPG